MTIPVVCPACKSRFQVSEKFAGKQGPCPKCKAVITIPKLDEQVVIHAPDEFATGSATLAKDAKGRSVLKPIPRKKLRVQPVKLIISLALTVTILAAAFLLRNNELLNSNGYLILGIGAFVLSLPLAYAGYEVLRDRELEGYYGKQLFLRLGIVAIVYALLWGGIALLKGRFFPGQEIQIVQMMISMIPFLLIGSLTSLGALEMEFGPALTHCLFYFVVTISLRLIMGLGPV